MLFTFPSRYWFTIGLSEVFSLTGWSRLIQSGFLVSRPTQDPAKLLTLYVYRTVTSWGRPFQIVPLPVNNSLAVLQPQNCLNSPGLGCSPFARHYLGNHSCFLFLRVLRCFSSPGLLPTSLDIRIISGWVVPFGYLRINSYLPIPAAFRSLSRPSSPLRAQASPVRP